MGNKNNKAKNQENKKIIVFEKGKIPILEKIENYDSKIDNKDERCVTSFAILRNNRILITFKGGIIKIYEFINKDQEEMEIKELIKLELEEYCFNYGIELENNDVAICSEDSTITIIKIFFDLIDNNTNNNNIENKYSIIQKINLGEEPIYIMKEFSKGELVLGCWNHILIFVKVSFLNKYELINKVNIENRTFSLIELHTGEVISTQCYAKTITIYNINNNNYDIINGIESNENPNIICKYNNQNEIVFVAFNKGINIISVVNKCLIGQIILNEIITSLCPFISHISNNKKEKEIFNLLCGEKKRVYGEKVNFHYNFIQIGFNLDKKKDKIGIINYDHPENNSFFITSLKNRVHFNVINAIENSYFSKNKIHNINNKEQMIISIGGEDRRLIVWKMKNNKS